MTSHYPPHLIIDNTHRAMIADAAPEHAQVEEYEPRVYTEDDLIFAAWLSGVAGIVITVVAVFLWQAVAS